MDRRQFLKVLGIVGTSAIATVGSHSWIAKSLAATPHPKRLVVIFLRGGIDGLNVVIPYTETDYYEARPTLAIPQPGKEKGALDLDGNFGLHPALSPLIPFWKDGTLAFVHACGSPDETRSHFDAQKYMESGTPGNKKTVEGWMNRMLGILPGKTPVEAVSVGSTLPLILAGHESASNISLRGNSARKLPIDQDKIQSAFDQLYASNDPLSLAYQEGRAARDTLLKQLEAEMEEANNGAPLPKGFAGETRQLASLMVRDPSIQLAFMDVGGWDTHASQGSSRGKLANRLKNLGEGLVTLVDRLGEIYADTTILVVSEFGRTVAENGNQGTDHGRGNAMWILNGSVRGGQVYGQWPGLSESERYEGRDLAITTDFREVVSTVLLNQFQVKPNQIDRIFPGYKPAETLSLFA
ncbi:hypothetical protein M595_3215 [Lyngbya aestuarii BL J]|uniref:Tat (Twin-arginine translocation) pathway signal sequence domain protein n=1 Tax=Lyngbya aestuarii BL J TaxID=1348334 RepID=U7QFU2_9CYAN|nr:DUF1501 domain-containing protein [Lyngbya aestuarii]ERT06778.1 hypothetical protein M595_3215 [Lyngbya aestuarii BL J]